MTGDKEVIQLYKLLSPFENQWIASDLKKTKVYTHGKTFPDLKANLSRIKDIPSNDILLSFVTPSYEPNFYQKKSNRVSSKKNVLPE